MPKLFAHQCRKKHAVSLTSPRGCVKGVSGKGPAGRGTSALQPAAVARQGIPSQRLPGRGRATALTRGGLGLSSTACQSEARALAARDTRARSEEVLEYFRVSRLGQQVTAHVLTTPWQPHPALLGTTLPTYSPAPQASLFPAEAPWVSQEVVLVHSHGPVVSSRLWFQHSPSENNLSSSSCP